MTELFLRVLRVLIGVLAVAAIVTTWAAVLSSCAKVAPPVTVECMVTHVAGKFTTETDKLNVPGDELVEFRRGDRRFLFPRNRVHACEQPLVRIQLEESQ